MAKTYLYENGLKIIVDNFSHCRSVATGIWVGAGCSHESALNNGVSHFIEHMLFKGTKSRSAFQIADSFEGLGANVNAFTGKEATCYYYKVMDEYNENCFEVLCDLFHNSVFDHEEMQREKGVVIEEINMVEDSPEDICFDVLASSVYGEHPLGQTILGPIENIERFTDKDLRDYMCEIYNPSNITVAFAGKITLEEAIRLVDKYLLPHFICAPKTIEYPLMHTPKRSFLYRTKDFGQANFALRFPSFPLNTKNSSTLSILNSILGGGMSSRLFQSIRERLGLAYSVYSLQSAQKNNGSFIIFCNNSPQNTEKAVEAVVAEIKKLLNEGITIEEFNRAKAQIKSALVFSQESAQTMMSALGKLYLMKGEIFDIDEKIGELNGVTIEGFMEIAHSVLDFSKMSGAYVGKECGCDILSLVE